MIEQAKALQKENILSNLKWEIGNVSEQLPYPSNSFSIVVTRFSFHHLLKPLSVLIEMKRVCTVGGQIIVKDPTPPLSRDVQSYGETSRFFSCKGANYLRIRRPVRKSANTDS